MDNVTIVLISKLGETMASLYNPKELKTFKIKFWERVKVKLGEAQIPLNTFQREAKMTNTEFSLLENGTNDFGFDRIYAVSKILKCNIGDLFQGF
jgi:hypothetical protein